MYRALELSKYIVSKCIDDHHPISNLQLQKILYYIQKDFLKRDSIAFADEIEAWQFGPVVPNVYYYYCGCGSMSIFFVPKKFSAEDAKISEEDKSAIDSIVISKRNLDPWIMVEETHKPNGAWDRIYQKGAGNRQVIPTNLIKEIG